MKVRKDQFQKAMHLLRGRIYVNYDPGSRLYLAGDGTHEELSEETDQGTKIFMVYAKLARIDVPCEPSIYTGIFGMPIPGSLDELAGENEITKMLDKPLEMAAAFVRIERGKYRWNVIGVADLKTDHCFVDIEQIQAKL
ncbi:MAG: hypothetical protein KJ601_03445 [Nanoarchaeota archaeon]|nr:hypothetical protein [Nanoarchaeota archaeon]MBU1704178.1 hypothetical protein [Nanoarchaeota archaeon]